MSAPAWPMGAYGSIQENDELTIVLPGFNINYGFWHGKFFNVIAVVPNHESYDKLKGGVPQVRGRPGLRQAREFYT